MLVKEFKGKVFIDLKNSLAEIDSSFQEELPLPLEDRVSYTLKHSRKDLFPAVSELDLSSGYGPVYFVCLSEDRLYTITDKTLFVYSLSDLTSPISTYPMACECLSGMIIDNRLYLGGRNLFVFKVNTSQTHPLTPVTIIAT